MKKILNSAVILALLSCEVNQQNYVSCQMHSGYAAAKAFAAEHYQRQISTKVVGNMDALKDFLHRFMLDSPDDSGHNRSKPRTEFDGEDYEIARWQDIFLACDSRPMSGKRPDSQDARRH
jgi:hypothetical protein